MRVSEAKVLPRFATTTKTTTTKSTGSTIVASTKFMPGKKGLKTSFSNLQNATAVSYVLSYESNGKSEGVVGSIKPSEGSATRELLFGTCSSGTCRYHTNIKNAVLKVTATLKSGKKQIKTFKVKV